MPKLKDFEVYVCPKCDGEKKNFNIPSPSFGSDGEPYYPDCTLCEGKGYIVVDMTEVWSKK